MAQSLATVYPAKEISLLPTPMGPSRQNENEEEIGKRKAESRQSLLQLVSQVYLNLSDQSLQQVLILHWFQEFTPPEMDDLIRKLQALAASVRPSKP